MATMTRALTCKFQTTKDGDVETTQFAPGDVVTVIQQWEALVLIKDQHGHFYNVPRDAVAA